MNLKKKAIRLGGLLLLVSIVLVLAVTGVFAQDRNGIQITVRDIDQGTVRYTIESAVAYDNAMAITAGYNDDLQMVDVVRTPVNLSAGDNDSSADLSGSFSLVKIFLVDADSYIPLSDAVSCSNTFYSAQFVDYDGSVLSSQRLSAGETPTRPCPPERDGLLFAGWSPEPGAVTADTVYTARYLTGEEPNIFRVSTVSGSEGDTVTVSVTLEGTVLLSGFDMRLYYDGDLLEYVEHDADFSLDVTANKISGANRMAFNFSSYKNISAPGKIMQITFRVKNADADFAPIWLSPISACYTDEYGDLPAAEINLAEGGVILR